jgi:ribosomal protein S17E
MGKIKTKLIKKTSINLLNKSIEFIEDFEKNKRILKGITPSKKVRNQIAGYLVRLKKQERIGKESDYKK